MICASEEDTGLALLSKYCWKREKVTSPVEDQDSYLRELKNLVNDYDVDVIIPIHENSLFPLSQAEVKQQFKGVEIPIPDFQTLKKVADKGELMKLASALGIPCPRTYFIDDLTSLETTAKRIKYPAIVKARLEKDIPPGPNRRYKRVNDPIECIKWYAILHERQPFPIIQEIVEGYGCGFFGLFGREGELLASAGHRRIREQFPEGGPSTFCESYYHPKVFEYGLRLLTEVQWYGIAMVEFKLDRRDGEPKLMEVNPRFWGTTPVAIFSGVDFPYLLYRLAKKEQNMDEHAFQTGVKMRFLCDDTRAFLRDARRTEGLVGKLGLVLRFIAELLNPFVKDGILSFDDIGSSVFYLRSTCLKLAISPLAKIRRRSSGSGCL
ncbi:MAG: hypothetical protein DRI39_04910 [Chloroflexi bacterium]|nr:MAG: hypothetical protein DRI39_04910 [Chloroflexota bacterium]